MFYYQQRTCKYAKQRPYTVVKLTVSILPVGEHGGGFLKPKKVLLDFEREPWCRCENMKVGQIDLLVLVEFRKNIFYAFCRLKQINFGHKKLNQDIVIYRVKRVKN